MPVLKGFRTLLDAYISKGIAVEIIRIRLVSES